MIKAKKEALENTLRRRLVAIRTRELQYYTDNCRNIGNQVRATAHGGLTVPSGGCAAARPRVATPKDRAPPASIPHTLPHPTAHAQAALISGLAYSGIRYHYLLERQQSWHLTEGDSMEEVIFLSLLSITLGTGLQTVSPGADVQPNGQD